MSINSMPIVRTQIVAECTCDNIECGHVFDIDWKCKNFLVYCPKCNREVTA
ncbi:hypothetical protein V7O66_13925 [Methanolobus sp. ZRKC3]|uniref:hypothetical protein n=1 Tax=Methanolobus sp. ZRKC3 TaxID=3125786 RepID=UPI0032511BFC